jgi:hypothetical protein
MTYFGGWNSQNEDNKPFHKKCVPRHYKMHKPEEEEEEDSCLPHVFSVRI